MRKIIITALLIHVALAAGAQKKYNVTSPSGNLSVEVSVGSEITYSVTARGETFLTPSAIAMELADGTVLGRDAKVTGAVRLNKKEHIVSPLYRQKGFDTEYNSLDLKMSGGFGLEFRAYGDGVAYRFYTTGKKPVVIKNETVEFNFAKDYPTIIPYAHRRADIYETSFESQYTFETVTASAKHPDSLAFTPVLVDLGKTGKALLMESDVESYPGIFLKYNEGKTGFKGVFPPRMKDVRLTGSGSKRPVSYEDFIAEAEGARTFPWRIVAYASEDTQLPVNNMVYQTAAPNRIGDTEWIKPGQSTWDWWNAISIYGVDFKTGINTDTYKYYIDFAAGYGIEYVLIDDGWYSFRDKDLLKPIPEMDIREICRYGKEKGVGIILWAVGNTLAMNAEEVCRHYSEMGVAGFKVDFFDAQDQSVVEDIYYLARITAKYRLMINYHGMYKPTGLSRAYPNVVNYEGVFGLEQMKWTDRDKADMPLNDVLIPYIRMAAGPMDYTQGAMLNANKADFRAVNNRPMSQGTRAHQVAAYIVFDSPFVTLCDTPTHYIREDETTRFITSVPAVFDSTRILSGKVGEYIVTARQKDGVWYVGGLTSWQERRAEVDLSFLGDGAWQATIFRDGINSGKSAEDYVLEKTDVTAGTKVVVEMAPGGGFAIVLTRK